MSNPHSKLVNDILAEFSHGNCRLFKRHVAKAKPIYSENVIQFGTPGEPDIQGFVKCHGYPYAFFIAIEVKTGKAVRSKVQIKYAEMLKKLNVIYILARSVDDVQLVFDELGI